MVKYESITYFIRMFIKNMLGFLSGVLVKNKGHFTVTVYLGQRSFQTDTEAKVKNCAVILYDSLVTIAGF